MIVAGNPGSGKSSILNSIIGRVKFESGISLGSGLTTALDSKRIGNVLYSDTPGLDDARIRDRAAKEISYAFRRGGKIKLIFVSTLEAGRLRSTDLATMRIIVEAIQSVGVDPAKQFSIIINKCEPEVLELLENKKNRAMLEVPLNSAAPAGRIAYMPYRDYAAGKHNVLVTTDSNVYKEFLRTAPAFDMSRNKSFAINANGFELTVQRLQEMVEELEKKLKEALNRHGENPQGGFRRFCRKLGSRVCDALDTVFDSFSYFLK